jgi:hypothetical protein
MPAAQPTSPHDDGRMQLEPLCRRRRITRHLACMKCWDMSTMSMELLFWVRDVLMKPDPCWIGLGRTEPTFNPRAFRASAFTISPGHTGWQVGIVTPGTPLAMQWKRSVAPEVLTSKQAGNSPTQQRQCWLVTRKQPGWRWPVQLTRLTETPTSFRQNGSWQRLRS